MVSLLQGVYQKGDWTGSLEAEGLNVERVRIVHLGDPCPHKPSVSSANTIAFWAFVAQGFSVSASHDRRI